MELGDREELRSKQTRTRNWKNWAGGTVARWVSVFLEASDRKHTPLVQLLLRTRP